MKVACLFSGGKDSAYALYWAQMQGWDVRCLITLISKNVASYMFHVPNIEWVGAQADALGMKLYKQTTEGKEEAELKDLKRVLLEVKQKERIRGIVVGALASEYQRMRINLICKELDMKVFAPLWHIPPRRYMNELLDAGFKIIISSIASEGLGEEWLGRILTKKNICDIEMLSEAHKFHTAFEGGEAETFVIDGPIFKKKIEIEEAKAHMEGNFTGIYHIEKIRVLNKINNRPYAH